jgi:hypothetical protein
MNWNRFVRIKSLSFFLVALTLVTVGGCNENLAAGGSCPLLCPQESAPLKDTIIDAVVLDTSATGFPLLGFETNLFLAHRRDSLDSRIITRFDSLPLTYKFQGVDSSIVRIDSVFIRAPRPAADSAVAFGANGTIEVYDVTAAANDTSTADLAAEFTAANKIGELAYAQGQSPDTLQIILDTARVRSRILNGRNLRIGLRMVSAGSDLVRIVSANNAGGIKLTLIPNRHADGERIQAVPTSFSPPEPEYLRAPLSDFTISVLGNVPGLNTLRVGGLPAHRVLMQFAIPSRIVDSSVIVRATLFLTQRPSTSADAGEAVAVQIVPILASAQVTDLHSQLEFAASQFFPLSDSTVTVPKDSGVVALEMVQLLRSWRGRDTVKTPRLAGLFLSSEASRVASFDFFSTEAAVEVRPRLRITFVTRVNTGQP